MGKPVCCVVLYQNVCSFFIGVAQLERLPELIRKREALIRAYIDAFDAFEGMYPPPHMTCMYRFFLCSSRHSSHTQCPGPQFDYLFIF